MEHPEHCESAILRHMAVKGAANGGGSAKKGRRGRLGANALAGAGSALVTPAPTLPSTGDLRVAIFGSVEPGQVRALIERRAILTKSAVNVFRRSLGLSIEQISKAIDASPRTIERQVRTSATLAVAAGDRAYRLARIADLAAEMLGDVDAARRWIQTPSRYLGGETPLAMIRTEVGTQIVEQSLHAIAYGGVG